MPGRGESKKYAVEACEIARKMIEDNGISSDEEKAAVISGVFSIYAQNVIPSYVLDTDYE